MQFELVFGDLGLHYNQPPEPEDDSIDESKSSLPTPPSI